MSFAYPAILWALTALAIPIVVHLFNFRRFRKVLFPNVAFLREIKQETQSKSRLKHLLILTSRLLALAAVILAFAQPFISSGGKTTVAGSRVAVVYVDNSFSMEAENEGARLLEIAKNKAFEIVNAFSPSDKFQLVTNDFEGRHQRLVSREEMTDLIHEIEVSSKSRTMSEVFTRMKDGLNGSNMPDKTAFIIADMQKSSTNLEAMTNDTTIQIRMVPCSASSRTNLYIDSVWFETPVRLLNQPEVLHVRIGNSSVEEKSNIPISLLINNVQKSVASVHVAANGKTEAELSFTNAVPGFKQCEVKIEDHPVVFDNSFHFSFEVAEQILVAHLSENGPATGPVATLFSGDPNFRYTAMDARGINFGQLQKQNLIIVDQLIEMESGLQSELEKFCAAGGSLFIIPAVETNLISINNLLSKLSTISLGEPEFVETKVNNINYQHPVYRNVFEKNKTDVDLPKVWSYYPIRLSSTSIAEPMMTLQNGSAFLVSDYSGKGKVYLSAVSLSREVSNLTSHALFPATLLCIADFSRSSTALFHTIGDEEIISLNNISLSGDETVQLKNSMTGEEFIPQHMNAVGGTEILIRDEMKNAGNYLLSLGDSVMTTLSFNYNRLESGTDCFTTDELKSSIENLGWQNASVLDQSSASIGKEAVELNEGKKLWWTLIVWALIFLAAEVLLIKFWR